MLLPLPRRCFINKIFKTPMSSSLLNTIANYLSTQPVEKAWVFGSFSRGEEREDSDIDLLVSFSKDSHIGLMKYSSMVCELEELCHRKVDMVQDGSLKDFAIENVNHDKILIYERAS